MPSPTKLQKNLDHVESAKVGLCINPIHQETRRYAESATWCAYRILRLSSLFGFREDLIVLRLSSMPSSYLIDDLLDFSILCYFLSAFYTSRWLHMCPFFVTTLYSFPCYRRYLIFNFTLTTVNALGLYWRCYYILLVSPFILKSVLVFG